MNTRVLTNPQPGGAIITRRIGCQLAPIWKPISQDVFSKADVENLWFVKEWTMLPHFVKLIVARHPSLRYDHLLAEYAADGRRWWLCICYIDGRPDWLSDFPEWTGN